MTYSEYDDFAWVYNKHWGPYADHAIRILDELLLKDIPDGARILDLCCGTGQLSGKLSARGYQVIGIDSSPGMLRFARENAPEADFIVQDARKFHSPPIYDSVISTYDSLNHIMSPEGLAAVFGSVFTALKSGGLFLFDLNTEAGYLHNWHDGTFGIIEDDHVCIAQLDYDSQEKIAQFDITIFRLLDGWQRSDLV
ncbi:MAG: methyltransferase domain-containing protein, partial [Chloroflexota bacterium]|nr:methyltransferase domain-containing protein [Chloroflexota bacterium]